MKVHTGTWTRLEDNFWSEELRNVPSWKVEHIVEVNRYARKGKGNAFNFTTGRRGMDWDAKIRDSVKGISGRGAFSARVA